MLIGGGWGSRYNGNGAGNGQHSSPCPGLCTDTAAETLEAQASSAPEEGLVHLGSHALGVSLGSASVGLGAHPPCSCLHCWM